VRFKHATVSALFDFESAGAGSFSFEPVNSFILSGPQANVSSAVDLQVQKVQVASSGVTVAVSGDIKKRSLPVLNKRAVSNCTDASRKGFIDARYRLPLTVS
jgi:deuterolysin